MLLERRAHLGAGTVQEHSLIGLRDLQGVTRVLGVEALEIAHRDDRLLHLGQPRDRRAVPRSGKPMRGAPLLQRFRGELVLLDSREGGGGARGAFNEDFAGEDAGASATRPQSRPQPAAFDADLDDDVPF